MTDLLTPPRTSGRDAVDLAELRPLRRGRTARLPEIAVGLIVMLGFGLAAVLWHLNATQKTPVLAMASDVSRGDVIERDDLRVVFVATDDAIAHVARDDAASIIGRVAAADLAADSLITRFDVLDGSLLAPGEAVVGLALEAGQVPSSRLRVGDIVNVIAGPTTSPDGQRAGEVIVSGAEVFAVDEDVASGRALISLKAGEADANRIAAAAEAGSVRLVWVGR